VRCFSYRNIRCSAAFPAGLACCQEWSRKHCAGGSRGARAGGKVGRRCQEPGGCAQCALSLLANTQPCGNPASRQAFSSAAQLAFVCACVAEGLALGGVAGDKIQPLRVFVPLLWGMAVLVSPMEHTKKIFKWLNFLQCWRHKQLVGPDYLRLQPAVFACAGTVHPQLPTMAAGCV